MARVFRRFLLYALPLVLFAPGTARAEDAAEEGSASQGGVVVEGVHSQPLPMVGPCIYVDPWTVPPHFYVAPDGC